MCTVKKRHINYDKQKKIINEAATEDGAQRKGNVDGYGDCDIMKKKEKKRKNRRKMLKYLKKQ